MPPGFAGGIFKVLLPKNPAQLPGIIIGELPFSRENAKELGFPGIYYEKVYNQITGFPVSMFLVYSIEMSKT